MERLFELAHDWFGPHLMGPVLAAVGAVIRAGIGALVDWLILGDIGPYAAIWTACWLAGCAVGSITSRYDD